MKKSILILCLITVCIMLSLGAVAGAASDYDTKSFIKIDNNVFKGKIGNVEGAVLVWVDVDEAKFDSSLEYGVYVFDAAKEDEIDITTGEFKKVEVSKNTFGYAFKPDYFTKDAEYAIKAYVRDGEDLTLSRSTAYVSINDLVSTSFTIGIQGAEVVCPAQEYASDNKNVREANTVQYFVYSGDKLLGAANHEANNNGDKFMRLNVIDSMFDENGELEEGEYPLTVKTVSGLTNGAISESFNFTVSHISTRQDFARIVCVNDDLNNFDNTATYYILSNDIDLTGMTWQSFIIKGLANGEETEKKVYCAGRYLIDTLDGRGHKITASFDEMASSIADKSLWVGGLFGKIAENACLRNVALDIDIKYNGNQGDAFTDPERNNPLCTQLGGVIENCYMKLRAQHCSATKRYRRDTPIGYPGNFMIKNCVIDYELKNFDNSVVDLSNLPKVEGDEFKYSLWWEDGMAPEIRDLVYITPSRPSDFAPHLNDGVKFVDTTRYSSMADFLSGTNGFMYQRKNMPNTSKALEDGTKVYADWNGFLKVTENTISICGNTVYTAPVEA